MRGLPRQETGGADLFRFPRELRGAELVPVDNSMPSLCGTTTTTTIDPTPSAVTSLLPPAPQHTSPRHDLLVRHGLVRTVYLGIRRLSDELEYQWLLDYLSSAEPSASFELVGLTTVAVAGQPQAGSVLAVACRHLGATLRLEAISRSVLDAVGEKPVVSVEARLSEAALQVDADLATLAARQLSLALGFAKRSLPGAEQAILKFTRLVAPRLYATIGVNS